MENEPEEEPPSSADAGAQGSATAAQDDESRPFVFLSNPDGRCSSCSSSEDERAHNECCSRTLAERTRAADKPADFEEVEASGPIDPASVTMDDGVLIDYRGHFNSSLTDSSGLRMAMEDAAIDFNKPPWNGEPERTGDVDTKPVVASGPVAPASVPADVPEPPVPISTPTPENKFDPPVEMLVDDEEEPPEAPKEATMSPFCARSPSGSPAASPVLIQGNESSQSSSGSEEILPDQSVPMKKVDVDPDFNQDVKPEPSTLRHINPDPLELDEPIQAERRVTTRLRRTVVRQPTNSEDDFFSDEEEDEEEEEEEEEMRKTIMIGGSYQAVVPEGLCKYGDAKPYKNADKLLWDPKDLSDDQIEKFLVSVKEAVENAAQGIDMLPMGAHTRDDEQALYLLMQCNQNIEEALKKWTSNPPAPSNTSPVWTDEECRNFENGLLMYGKDFHTIQAQKVRTRSVAELVQFYYLWKKTERHDIFANKMRPDKKKYMLHPGITLLVFEMLEKENNKEASAKDSVTA